MGRLLDIVAAPDACKKTDTEKLRKLSKKRQIWKCADILAEQYSFLSKNPKCTRCTLLEGKV